MDESSGWRDAPLTCQFRPSIEHLLVEEAVQAPFANWIAAYPVSTRTGNVQVHVQHRVLLSRLWVQ